MKPLALVGKGFGWWNALGDESSEIWCVSSIFELMRNTEREPDKIFQLHQRETFEPWLKEQQKRVVLIDPDQDYPEAQVLPAAYLVKKHGFKFGSTISWMLAYAVELGYKQISIHGIHMAHRTEYAAQRDSFFYFYGYAEAQGVTVNIGTDSGVFLGNQKYGVI